MIHRIPDPSAFSSNQPWEDEAEVVTLKVLIRKKNTNVESPSQDWYKNRAGMKERDEPVRDEDNEDLDDTERV